MIFSQTNRFHNLKMWATVWEALYQHKDYVILYCGFLKII